MRYKLLQYAAKSFIEANLWPDQFNIYTKYIMNNI